jgi:5-enolpyruvylshikimate-3-phosphate synthase
MHMLVCSSCISCSSLQVMGLLGAKVEWSPYSIRITGPSAFGKPLTAIDHDCNDIPDAAMTLAVAALFAEGCVACGGVGRNFKDCVAP